MSSNIVTISDYAINLNSGANTLVVTGTITATGNISGDVVFGNNILTTGIVSATGNITGGNLAGENLVINNISSDDSTFVSVNDGLEIYGAIIVNGDSITTGNIIGGNLLSNGVVSAVGDILTATQLSATGNVIGGNILTWGLISAAGTLDVAGDATITGNLVVNGNITYINSDTITTNEKSITLANNQSTAANVDGSGIDVGNTNIAYWRFNNSTTSWQSNVGLTPAANLTLDLGGVANYWATAYVNAVSSAATVDSVGNITGGNILTGGLISATSTITANDNITGGNILTGGQISATGNITGDFYIGNGYYLSGVAAASANAAALIGNTLSSNILFSSLTGLGNLSNLTVVGNTTTSNLLATTNISAVGNVGGSYLFGNGVNLTGIVAIGSTGGQIINGNSNVVIAANSNVTVSVSNVANVVTWTAGGQYITGNLEATGRVSATGNVTGNYFLGNGYYLTGVITSVANINLGTSNITVVTAPANTTGGNITVNINGTSNVVYWANTGEYITGLLSVSGNVVPGNVTTAGQVSATGNVTGGNINTGGSLSIGGNVIGNLLPSANITYDLGANTQRWRDLWLSNSTIYLGNSKITANATALVMTNPAGGNVVLSGTGGNISGGNITGSGIVSATGNITGGNIVTAGIISAAGGIKTGNTLSVTGNIVAGNLSAQNLVVNNISSDDSTFVSIQDGLNVLGDILVTNGTTVTGNVTGGNILTAGVVSATDTITGGNLATGGTASSTGNITGGNILTAGLISAAGAITGAAITGTSLTVSTGNIAGGNIVNNNANGVGNIGDSSTYFNTVFAKATSAQYADVAEMYTADHSYAPGTVVVFGGGQEVTISGESHDARIAGVVSTNPAYRMNSGLEAEHSVAVALLGRVPCQVTGLVKAGDRMVSSSIAGVAESLDIARYQPGTIIGKALENYSGSGVGTIEIVVGRI